MSVKQEIFSTMPIPKAFMTLAVPTVISQIITIIYNMADTFFIGQLNDPAQVAAATIAMPAFVFLTGIANLFGIGGSSLISRKLGQGDQKGARQSAAFSIWTAALIAFLYGLLIMAFRPVILPFLGTNTDTYELCYQYVFWTIIVGAVPTVLNTVLAHLIRAEGLASQASFGVAMGGILNMILDPIFILFLGMEIQGAAIATMISNVIALIYFLVLIYRRRDGSVISLNIKEYTLGDRIPAEIITVGFPSFVMTIMSVVSNTVLNRLITIYSNEAMAGMGIAKKINMLAFSIAQGMTQGILPLIGFNYTAKNYSRIRDAIRMTLTCSIGFTAICAIIMFGGAGVIANLFIDDAQTIGFAKKFLRIICITCPTTSVTFMVTTYFQAVGQKLPPLILSLLRKGGLDVPFMLLFRQMFGVAGVAMGTPIADASTMVVALVLFWPWWKKLKLDMSAV